METELNLQSNVLWSRITGICPDFVLDKDTETAIDALRLYFSADPAFEGKGFGKLAKGLFLAGNVGTGKTLIMTAAAGNPRKPFRVIPTNRIAGYYQTQGIEGIERFFNGSQPTLGVGPAAYCFDDLGAENMSARYMGNELNVMAEIILERYSNKHFIPFHYTHFTTNLTQEEIINLYGTRIHSRLKEMCNVIVLKGTDKRK